MWMETKESFVCNEIENDSPKEIMHKKSSFDLWVDLLVGTGLFYICQCTHLINVMRLESVRACECFSALLSIGMMFDHFRYYNIVNISFNKAGLRYCKLKFESKFSWHWKCGFHLSSSLSYD